MDSILLSEHRDIDRLGDLLGLGEGKKIKLRNAIKDFQKSGGEIESPPAPENVKPKKVAKEDYKILLQDKIMDNLSECKTSLILYYSRICETHILNLG